MVEVMVMIMLTTMRMIWFCDDDVMRNEDDFILWHPEWAWLYHIWGLFFAPDIWFVRSYIFWPQHIWGSYKRDFAPDAFAFWSFKRCTLQIFWLCKRGKPLPSSSWIPQFQDSLHIITTISSSGPRWSPYHGWLQCQLGWPAWGMMTLYIEQQDSWMYSIFEKSYVMTIDELKLLGVWTCACSAWSWMSDCESGRRRLQVRTRIV